MWPTNWLFSSYKALRCKALYSTVWGTLTYLHRPLHSPVVAIAWSSTHTRSPPWTAEGETCALCEPESQIKRHSLVNHYYYHIPTSCSLSMSSNNLYNNLQPRSSHLWLQLFPRRCLSSESWWIDTGRVPLSTPEDIQMYNINVTTSKFP